MTAQGLSAIYLKDPEQNNRYLKVQEDGSITYVENIADATDFKLENISPANLVGPIHQQIKASDKMLKIKHDGKLAMTAKPNNQGTRWTTVVHYQYMNKLQNRRLGDNRIKTLEKESANA